MRKRRRNEGVLVSEGCFCCCRSTRNGTPGDDQVLCGATPPSCSHAPFSHSQTAAPPAGPPLRATERYDTGTISTRQRTVGNIDSYQFIIVHVTQTNSSKLLHYCCQNGLFFVNGGGTEVMSSLVSQIRFKMTNIKYYSRLAQI